MAKIYLGAETVTRRRTARDGMGAAQCQVQYVKNIVATTSADLGKVQD